MCVSFFVDAMYFNPLPSHEGRRQRDGPDERQRGISIHSPRMRGDRVTLSV